jgi:phosphoglycolate phosphatase
VGHLHCLIAFDLDGTLVDSRRDLAESANQLVEELGGRPLTEEAIGNMVGEGAGVLVRRVLQASGREGRADALRRFLEIYDTRLLNHTRLYDGIGDVVRRVKARARLTVLTNKPTGPSERILEALGVRDLFEEVIGGDREYGRKPDPRGLLAMMASAESTAERTLLVGDSPIDLETARQAATRCCLVSYGFGFRDELHADRGPEEWIAHDVPELSDALDRFLASAERSAI